MTWTLGSPRIASVKHFEVRLAYYRRVATGKLFVVKSAKPSRLHDWMTLVCPNDHQFRIKAKDLLRLQRCQACYLDELEKFRQKMLVEARNLAHERGGKCLSPRYLNAKRLLVWECHQHHRWEATFSNVRSRGSWCPTCARRLPRPGRTKAAAQRRQAREVVRST